MVKTPEKHQCLMLRNPFFALLYLRLSSVAIVKKVKKKNSHFTVRHDGTCT